MPGSDLYFDRNTCSLTALAFSPSILFAFIFFSVNIFHHSFQKMVTTHSLHYSRNASLAIAQKFNAKTPQGTIQKLTLWQGKDVRFTHGLPKTRHVLDWETNEPQNMSRNIYDLKK